MKFIIGCLTVIGCVFGGYMAMGGHIGVLWQPFEYVIILGAGIGAYIISNSGHVLKHTLGGLGGLLKPPTYKKADYMELLGMLYSLFKTVKTKGWLAIEAQLDAPYESDLFKPYGKFIANHHAVDFLCDYLRMAATGAQNPHDIEALMDEEIDTLRHEEMHVSHAMQGLADGMPALGIVAAVLGVIKTMGSITKPPEVLGHMIGGALVGTFFGVFVSYGFFAPMASSMKARAESDCVYFVCIKLGLLAFMKGSPPAIAVEFARKALTSDIRPTFAEVEAHTQGAPA